MFHHLLVTLEVILLLFKASASSAVTTKYHLLHKVTRKIKQDNV